jgi:hypothetical protein
MGPSVSVASIPSNASGSSAASGFFSDFFGLSVPGYANGTSLTVTAQVRVEGYTSAATLPRRDDRDAFAVERLRRLVL